MSSACMREVQEPFIPHTPNQLIINPLIYLPIQKREKMVWRRSEGVISPVISPM